MRAWFRGLRLDAHIPQLFIVAFLVLLAGAAQRLDSPVGLMLGDSLVRLGMNGVLALSLVPMLNVGAGLNFGLPVAISAGLVGMCLAVNFKIRGMPGFLAALAFACAAAVILGWLYGRLLNRVKGREEIAAAFVGFSFISIMNFFWATAPFSNPAMLWPIGGKGMRPTIGLRGYFAGVLNSLGSFTVFGVTVPSGLLVFFGLMCLFTYLFFKTSLGRAMIAVGESEPFARMAGIRVERLRLLGVTLSTIIGAVGICVYAQSYGFIELYDAPLMMAFPAASAVLAGGCLGRRATIWHVILGTYLFQTTYVLSGPVANALMVPEAAEIIRMMVSNGIILYALLYEGARRRKHAA